MLGVIKDIARRLKVSYAVYNLFSKSRLRHNPPLYKKYGIKKKYFSPIQSSDFAEHEDLSVNANLEKIKESQVFESLDPTSQQSLLEFSNQGYSILRGFFKEDRISAINTEIENLLEAKKVSLRYANRKIMFSHRTAETVNAIGHDPRLLELLSGLLDGDPVLYQSINFPKYGSEQRVHSDSIHLTTYPKGGMAGVWIALEPIDLDNGPISYYPGTHKLDFAMNAAYDNEGSYLTIGDKDYVAYEDMIEERLKNISFEKKLFLAQPGDVLIWHANLLHAGEPQKDKNRTRKSLVMHYFNNDCIWYHELSQRPVLS